MTPWPLWGYRIRDGDAEGIHRNLGGGTNIQSVELCVCASEVYFEWRWGWILSLPTQPSKHVVNACTHLPRCGSISPPPPSPQTRGSSITSFHTEAQWDSPHNGRAVSPCPAAGEASRPSSLHLDAETAEVWNRGACWDLTMRGGAEGWQVFWSWPILSGETLFSSPILLKTRIESLHITQTLPSNS